jgi:hypothetical protein
LFWEETVLVFLYNIDQVFVICTEIPVFSFIDTDINIGVPVYQELLYYFGSVKEI